MFYQMQEGYLTLSEGDWQDRSVHMLAANHLPLKGINVVVAREALPAGVGLADYIANQKSVLAKALTTFKLLADRAESVNGMPGHYLEFTWDNAGNAMHQIIIVISLKESVLNLTATTPGSPDERSRAELLAVMKSFQSGHAPQPQEGVVK
ncbi:MAG TPA: DcrB-related protein [Elusimicrobiales bacterium]|jgi:hypothetical protein|nr:DcrB-related protein [Elusimicrobiales bacterium]